MKKINLSRKFLFLSVLVAIAARADEGMWLFNNLPTAKLKADYNFTPTPEWIDHLMKASARDEVGGSASFISPNGLLMTNHHVAAPTLQAASSAENDYLKNGFHAKSLSDELKTKHIELKVLQSIQDVTDRVKGAVTADMSAATANQARKAMMSQIEKELKDQTGLTPQVVELFNGGKYNAYLYKKYTDVRVVWAPEQSIAFLGGDFDNFNFPRYDLDIALFRVYENGQPIKSPDFLKLATEELKENDLIFVSGNPGTTNRADTMAEIRNYRNSRFPWLLQYLKLKEISLQQYGLRGDEQIRQSYEDLKGIENSRKAYDGRLGALQDPDTFRLKQAQEQDFRGKVLADPTMRQLYSSAWDDIGAAVVTDARLYGYKRLLEGAAAFDSQLFTIARTLVRLPAEDAKPEAKRLPEFSDANRDSLLSDLLKDEPVYREYEKAKLATSLSFLQMQLDPGDPLILAIMDGKSPDERATELVDLSRLDDPTERKRVLNAGALGIEGSADPMINLAKLVDRESRRVRREYEDTVEGPITTAKTKLSAARFSIYGDTVYPDATFTLRLAYGTVKGWNESGTDVPAFTTMGDTFKHSAEHPNQVDYQVPKSWADAKDKISPTVPFNFVSTADIIGGNSGSPVVNAKGEVVGLIFDGNLHSLGGNVVYDGRNNRAVAVDMRAIMESIDKIYSVGGEDLAKEIRGEAVSPRK